MSSIFHVGLPMFHVFLEKADEAYLLEVGAVYDGKYKNIPGAFRKKELVGGIDGALRTLVQGLDGLSGEFSGNSDPDGLFDVGALVGHSDLRLVRHGRFLRLQGREQAEIRFSSESVIVLEVLVALGNEMARLTSDAGLRSAWLEAAARCDVLPMDVDNWFEPVSIERLRHEAGWYASRLGQTLDVYENASRWLHARQIFFAAKELDVEPTWEDYAGVSVLDTPGSQEIDIMVARAAAILKQSVEEFVCDALAGRNNAVRQEVVFRRWYGSDRQDSTETS